jgi:(2Fe-2S) ferredoxin
MYKRHVFVCTNERPKDHPRGCCHEKGGVEVRDALKAALTARGLHRAVRGNAAGCLDACQNGVSMVIYPEGIWYGGVSVADVPEIIERTIVNGEVIDRLLMPEDRYKPSSMTFKKLTL